MNRHLKGLWLCAGLTVASMVTAQQTFTPSRWENNVRPTTFDTRRNIPQIKEAITPGLLMPRNPKANYIPEEMPFNNLPVGGLMTAIRAKGIARAPGISFTGWVPPDPNVAAGPNHVIQVVNSDIAFFNKTTLQKTFQVSMGVVPGATEGFFENSGIVGFVFDPKCFFDVQSQRFFVVALELDEATTTSKCLVAVSDDADPNGTWYKYRFESKANINGQDTWLDYPGFAGNKDAIVITGNQFGFSSGFQGVQVLTIKKAPMLTGGSATTSSIIVTNAFTLQPARTIDTTIDKIYMVAEGNTTADFFVYALTNVATSPSLTSANVTIPAYSLPTSDAVSTNGRQLDNLGFRMMDADYFNGKLYCAHTVRAGGGDNRNAVRWYEINVSSFPGSTPNTTQAGLVTGGPGEHVWMPGIAVNSLGDVGLIFSRSSASIVADVMVSGRRVGDPAGFMGTPTKVESSLAPQYGNAGYNRWGDYFSLEVDPSDLATFFGTGMVANSNGSWLTTINKLTISDITPGQSTVGLPAEVLNIYSDAQSNPSVQGTNLVGGIPEILDSDNNDLKLTSVKVNPLGEVAAVELSFNIGGNASQLKYLGTRIEANALNNTTGMVWLYDFVAGKYVQMKSWRLSPSGTGRSDFEVKRNRTRYVDANGNVKMVFRAIMPSRPRPPVPFEIKLDLAQVRVRF